MRRSIEVICVALGIITAYFTLHYFREENKIEDKLKVIAFGSGFLFFAYKLLTGWLFINLNVSLESEREPADNENDHLALKITLAKGSIDSLWVTSIECRISDCHEKNGTVILDNFKIIEAFGTKKRDPVAEGQSKKMNYWKGDDIPLYVLSPNETAVFSCYTTVPKKSVAAVEIAAIGTRPFYGIEKLEGKRIQWRSSFIILP
jgi:hypothetical protein